MGSSGEWTSAWGLNHSGLIAWNQLQVCGTAEDKQALPRGGYQVDSRAWWEIPAAHPDDNAAVSFDINKILMTRFTLMSSWTCIPKKMSSEYVHPIVKAEDGTDSQKFQSEK